MAGTMFKVYVGNENCTACGKKHKKVFEFDGKPYGFTCAKKLFGIDLSAPAWLYELAETWMKKDSGYTEDNYDCCTLNFFNHYGLEEGGKIEDRYGESLLWNKPVRIRGYSIKVDWQYEINDYILRRYRELYF